MSELNEFQFDELIDYIKKESKLTYHCIDFVSCGRIKELRKVKFYARVSVSTQNRFFKGLSKDNWEDFKIYIEKNQEIKKFTYNLSFSYLIDEIMDGYKNDQFGELNPSSLYILPNQDKKKLHIYFEIETFPFKYLSTI